MASAAKQPPQQQHTTLEFYQAMSDFKKMFPQMDDDVIEAVLRSNQGAVDTTIDQLLAMSTDNENEKIRSEFEDDNPNSKSLKVQKKNKSETKKVTQKSMQKWNPPLLGPLPESFLRISNSSINSNDGLDSGIAREMNISEDEMIAMFLQNEEFMAELGQNEDFLSTLEKDSKLHTKCETATDEDLFRERLKNMGKASRRKFEQLTKVFTRSKKRNGRQLLPQTPSCDDLLDPDESSTRNRA